MTLLNSSQTKIVGIVGKLKSFEYPIACPKKKSQLDSCFSLQRLYPAVHVNDLLPVSFIEPKMESGPWIAGGAVNCWYQNTSVKSRDIDVWCNSSEQAQLVIDNLIKRGASVMFRTENAETLNLRGMNLNFEENHYNVGELSLNGDISWKIQIIRKKYFPSAEKLVQNFDITVCQLATDGKKFCFSDDQVVYDLKHKILRFSKDSKISIKRMLKYVFYGYLPTQNQKQKALDVDLLLEKNNNPWHNNYDDFGDW